MNCKNKLKRHNKQKKSCNCQSIYSIGYLHNLLYGCLLQKSLILYIAWLKVPVNTWTTFSFKQCWTEKAEDLLECSNDFCRKGSWFHFSCMGLVPDDIDPDERWFCSDECASYSANCFCKQTKNDASQWVDNGLKGVCANGRYFHPERPDTRR